MPYPRLREHEASSCLYAPCDCPVPGCAHQGRRRDLVEHIRREHGHGAAVRIASKSWEAEAKVVLDWSTPHKVLQCEADTARVFILCNDEGTVGLVSVGPPPPANQEISSTIEISAPNGVVLTLGSSCVECKSDWTGPNDVGLTMRVQEWTSGSVTVKVKISMKAK